MLRLLQLLAVETALTLHIDSGSGDDMGTRGNSNSCSSSNNSSQVGVSVDEGVRALCYDVPSLHAAFAGYGWDSTGKQAERGA